MKALLASLFAALFAFAAAAYAAPAQYGATGVSADPHAPTLSDEDKDKEKEKDKDGEKKSD